MDTLTQRMPHVLIKAVAFAAHKHRQQRRKGVDAAPYINHPIGVAHVLAFEGNVTDTAVLCGATLHDTIEDTDTTYEELVREFDVEIAGLVREVTDDKTLPKDVRKQLQIEHGPHLSVKAKLVKLADKICNLRDILESPPNWSVERKQQYFEWAEKVVAGLRGSNRQLEAVLDELLRRREELL